MKIHCFSSLILFASCFLPACAPSSQVETSAVATYSNQAPVPQFINDPYERYNRGVWAANAGLAKGVIYPSTKVYKTVLPQPVRTSIQNFDRNITYPGRLVNNLLQGRWTGMGDETLRFLSNTTVGVGGLFDPATRWNIEKSDANFSQTFSKWGWRPKTYVVLPFFGPSDERNTLGLVADRASSPLIYLNQPERNATFVTTYNGISRVSDRARRIMEAEPDSYIFGKQAWTYISKYDQPYAGSTGPVDSGVLQTLAAASIAPKNKNFLGRGRKIKVKIPTTGRKLKFNYWLQPHPAPLVYIAPGLSSHRLSNLSLAVAENLHEQGYSVVSTTSVFHPEFMENASTANLPIYLPTDCKDLVVALTEADKALAKKHPGHFTKRALVGMSMGGFMTINMSLREEKADSDLIPFDRYVAVNSPVDMVYGAMRMKEFVQSPMAWPEAERQDRVNNALHKAAVNGVLLSKKDQPPLQFDQIESEYLVGLSFRLGLRNILFSSQIRNNQGILQTPLSKWKREPAYNEIINYSYHDYFNKFAVPYYQQQGISRDELLRHANLRNHELKLRNQSDLRIITNRNDFLLPDKDLKWLQKNFSSSRLTIFPQGGHLGNLNSPDVEKAIVKALEDLKAT